MDFVERIFGVTPDGGSGALEVGIFCALVLVSLLILRAVRVAQKQ